MKFYRQSAVSKKTLRDILSRNEDYSEDDKKKIIEEIFEIDPDKKGHKNSIWLAKQYLITEGNLPKNLTKLLDTFNTLCDNNRITDKELKNYKSIKDLRDIVESVAEKGISRRDELEKRSIEGLKELDRQGEFVLYLATDYEVWKDRINKKINEEGYECGWCIKKPIYWNKYSKDAYFYVEKNGKPWLLADNNSKQCCDYQNESNPENIKPCAYLLYKNGLDLNKDLKIEYLFQDENVPEKIKIELLEDTDNAYELLRDKIIKKEDGEIFKKAVEKAIKDSYDAYELLWNEIITKSDGEIYNKVVKRAIENIDTAYRLLLQETITKEDEEIFKKALEKAIEDSDNAYRLLRYKTITKEDGEIFNKVVKKAIENRYNAYYLLDDKIITNKDGEIFKQVVKNYIEYSDNAYKLLSYKLITKSDGEIFKKVLEKAIEDSENAYYLLRDKIIKKSDVSPELWEKVLASAERYDTDIRQKFASRGYVLGKFYKISRIRIFFSERQLKAK